jgi:hypothetical protein
MDTIALLVVALICPLTMGAMMLYMRRSHRDERMRDGEPTSRSSPPDDGE